MDVLWRADTTAARLWMLFMSKSFWRGRGKGEGRRGKGGRGEGREREENRLIKEGMSTSSLEVYLYKHSMYYTLRKSLPLLS